MRAGTAIFCSVSAGERWEGTSTRLMAQQTNFELRRKVLQLEALYDVGRALNTLRPEGELLEDLMQRAIAVLDAMTGFVFSLDDRLNIHHVFSFGVDSPSLADGVVRQAMTTRTA